MSSQKAYLVIADQLGIGVIQTDRIDPTPAEHIEAAIDYVNSFIVDSLDSFSDVRFIYDILLQKDEAGELNIEPSEAEKMAVAWFSAMGISIDNYTKKYVLNTAQYIQTQFENLSVDLDTPEFEKKTKDRITYSVYCPTYNETYTLSYNPNNIDQGQVVVTIAAVPEGNYVGSVNKTMTITQADLSAITLSYGSVEYDGLAHQPTITVTAQSSKVGTPTYTTTYLRDGVSTIDFTSAGTITVQVTGNGNTIK